MADDWYLLGEFTRDIGLGDTIRFLVERNIEDPALHGISCDEGTGLGPRPVAVFTEPETCPTVWRPTWDGDPMSPGIEVDARDLARRDWRGSASLKQCG
ncbi:hypothetical protein [Glycomyces albidus]|uniref:Uncharacterized protein n=1 Tax=Glycomyces albidus TaxID=2656774 RepID=A0A6L5GG67_9ACTN|nr:hypothetical protein [Glycomyces albidus]MQM28566.1 hypothetical protein [Glycomyces albidus]